MPDLHDKQLHRFAQLIEQTTFRKIFFFWLCMVFIFAGIYFTFILINDQAILYRNEPVPRSVKGFFDMVYFSFMTSAPSGYGDIIPFGWVRMFAIMEVVCGFIILGIFISKLVSTKQDLIIEELYNISFDEKINKIRSALYLLRGDFRRMNEKCIIETYNAGNAKTFWVSLTTLDTLLSDSQRLVCRQHQHLKEIDPLRLELLFNSIDMTLNKLIAVVEKLESKNISWRTKAATDRIESIIHRLKELTEHYHLRSINAQTQEKIAITKELMERLSALRSTSQTEKLGTTNLIS